MVYHLYDGKMSHLSGVLEGILKYANKTFKDGKEGVSFLIYIPENLLFGSKEEESMKYKQLFKKYLFKNYTFIYNDFQLIKAIIRIKKKKEKLVIHSEFTLYNKYPLFLIFLALLGRKILKNIIKVEWGVNAKIKQKGIKNKIRNNIQKYVYTNLGHIVVLSSEDKLILTKRYSNANVIEIGYFVLDEQRINENMIKLKDGEPLKILVSHSGHVHNNHIKTLDLLSKFKNENIEIMCPLCYGPAENIENVIQYGKRLFGEKFKYFTELKPKEQYIKLITQHHIYLTSAEIQTGLFAFYTALINGLKIFVGDNIFNSFKDSGYIYYHINELVDINFNEFRKMLTESEFANNQIIYIKKNNNNEKIELWKRMYSE